MWGRPRFLSERCVRFGSLQAGQGANVYNNNGNNYVRLSMLGANAFTMTLWTGGSDLAGGGTATSPAMFSYTTGIAGANVVSLGGSLNPGNSAYNIGTATLPWNNIYGVDVTATGTLTVGPVGSFYNRVFAGADITCTSIADGWMGLRTDTRQIEFCQGGNVYKVQGL